MLYLTNDGQKFFADSSAQLVRLLREASFVPSDNDKDFMAEVAERVTLQDHTAHVATDNVENFIESLVACGFLKRRGK